jgi:hypothetical protein
MIRPWVSVRNRGAGVGTLRASLTCPRGDCTLT